MYVGNDPSSACNPMIGSFCGGNSENKSFLSIQIQWGVVYLGLRMFQLALLGLPFEGGYREAIVRLRTGGWVLVIGRRVC